MLPKFIKIYPHEYKRVLGVPRKGEQPAAPVPVPHAVSARTVLA
jgi:hypothetical protein